MLIGDDGEDFQIQAKKIYVTFATQSPQFCIAELTLQSSVCSVTNKSTLLMLCLSSMLVRRSVTVAKPNQLISFAQMIILCSAKAVIGIHITATALFQLCTSVPLLKGSQVVLQ